jgi:hypothetical protein
MLPVHGEVGDEEGLLLLCLPVPDRARGPDEVDAVPLTGRDEVLGADLGGVDQMLGREEALGGERGVDRLGPHGLMDVGRSHVGVEHQAW